MCFSGAYVHVGIHMLALHAARYLNNTCIVNIQRTMYMYVHVQKCMYVWQL